MMEHDSASCLVTFVATSRNDGHGGDLERRMQWFIDGLAAQCEAHKLASELIMVEWNPPQDREPLRDALRWPAHGGALGVRIVTVPPEVHANFDNAENLPLFQMIAKNAGIRRARGDFVIATNIDILFSDQVMEALSRRLRSGSLYRADRHDVMPHPPEGVSVEAALSWCRRSTIRIMRREGTLLLPDGEFLPIYQSFREVLWAWRRRQSRRLLARLARLPRAAARHTLRRLRRAGVLLRRVAARIERGDFRLPRKRAVAARRDPRNRARRFVSAALALCASPILAVRELHDVWITMHRLPRPHTNACGDFTGLSAKDWAKLRGYPEWPIFSWHIDSVLLHQALAAGLSIIEFPRDAPVYHLEHGRGAMEGIDLMFQRLDERGIPFLTSNDFIRIATDLAQTRAPFLPTFNEQDWGLADLALPEVEVTTPYWSVNGAHHVAASRSETGGTENE